MSLKEQIARVQQDIIESFAQARTDDQVEQVRVAFLGRQGKITELMAQLVSLSPEEKRDVGPLLNALKLKAQTLLQERKKQLEDERSQQVAQAQRYFDVTAYKLTPEGGNEHIYTAIGNELEDIFVSMGYEVVDGPEVDTDFYNFTALNIPAGHPARDAHDTFWLNVPHMLMRTHTSNVQVRTMQARKPPFALYSSGRCFRNESVDATHDFMFRQGELVVVGKDISMANLLATARLFLQAFFRNSRVDIRVRPGYFPFVEPGVEIDATCPFCTSGCSVCKMTGYIELLGAGMVHPHVLKFGDIDPDEYAGFALGFGLARLAIIRHGIDDIRLFHSPLIDVLRQF